MTSVAHATLMSRDVQVICELVAHGPWGAGRSGGQGRPNVNGVARGAEPPGTRRHERLHFLTVSVDDFETPPAVAVMLTVVLAVTANVVI